MVFDERCLASSSDRQFLEQVKRTIGIHEPPRVITICKGDMDSHNIVSIHPHEESFDHTRSVDATNASLASSIVNSDCAMESEHGLPTNVDEGGSSYQELHSIIRTLYNQLQISDSKLAREKERRKARERNIATMANEIIGNKATIKKQNQRIDEVSKSRESFFF